MADLPHIPKNIPTDEHLACATRIVDALLIALIVVMLTFWRDKWWVDLFCGGYISTLFSRWFKAGAKR